MKWALIIGVVVVAIVALIFSMRSRAQTYTIQPGDTLTAIAKRFHTSVARLVMLNGITNPDLIFAGATLRV